MLTDPQTEIWAAIITRIGSNKAVTEADFQSYEQLWGQSDKFRQYAFETLQARRDLIELGRLSKTDKFTQRLEVAITRAPARGGLSAPGLQLLKGDQPPIPAAAGAGPSFNRTFGGRATGKARTPGGVGRFRARGRISEESSSDSSEASTLRPAEAGQATASQQSNAQAHAASVGRPTQGTAGSAGGQNRRNFLSACCGKPQTR
jgi:hypothetical protein